MTSALSYRREGDSAASAWEDDGGRSVAVAPALRVVRETGEAVPEGLDWAGFSARCFAGRRRHDFEAVKGYEAYRNRGRQL